MPRRSLPTFALNCSKVVAMIPDPSVYSTYIYLFIIMTFLYTFFPLFPDTRILTSERAARASGRDRRHQARDSHVTQPGARTVSVRAPPRARTVPFHSNVVVNTAFMSVCVNNHIIKHTLIH